MKNYREKKTVARTLRNGIIHTGSIFKEKVRELRRDEHRDGGRERKAGQKGKSMW